MNRLTNLLSRNKNTMHDRTRRALDMGELSLDDDHSRAVADQSHDAMARALSQLDTLSSATATHEPAPEPETVAPVPMPEEEAPVVTPVMTPREQVVHQQELVRQQLDQHTLDTMKIIENPVSAIDDIIAHAYATIETYNKSKGLAISQHAASLATVSDAKASKTRSVEEKISTHRNMIAEMYREIAELEQKITDLSNGLETSLALFDERVEQMEENHKTNLGSYDRMIAAKRSEIKVLTALNIEHDETVTSPTPEEKAGRVQMFAKGSTITLLPDQEDDEEIRSPS